MRSPNCFLITTPAVILTKWTASWLACVILTFTVRRKTQGQNGFHGLPDVHQWKAEGKVKLFEGIDGYGNGEQTRDFIYVKDVVKVNFFFWDHPELSGVYNCGTGHAHTFNTLAKGVLKHFGSGTLEYIPFPDVLRGKYQSYTQADTTKLLEAGYDGGFTDIEDAVAEYCALLDRTGGYYTYEA